MSDTTKTELGVDPRIIKALGHPLRQRILQVLNTRVASPSEIAAQLDEPLCNVSYHVKILLGNDAVELVETAPVRGAVEHFYRATMRPSIDAPTGRSSRSRAAGRCSTRPCSGSGTRSRRPPAVTASTASGPTSA